MIKPLSREVIVVSPSDTGMPVDRASAAHEQERSPEPGRSLSQCASCDIRHVARLIRYRLASATEAYSWPRKQRSASRPPSKGSEPP
jgi:hypothetical protein